MSGILTLGTASGNSGGRGGGGAFPCPASPRFVLGTGTGGITSASSTVAPSGGTAPYTYLWAYVSGQHGITITSATSAGTTFSGAPGPGDVLAATFRCTVTDNAGKIGYSNNVGVVLTDTSA